VEASLLILLIVGPFLLAGIVAGIKAASLLAVVWVLAGLGIGLVLMPLSGTLWLQLLAPTTLESQGGGIGYLVAILPFLVYSGGITGAWSVAVGYWRWAGQPNFQMWQGIALVGSLTLGGVLPGALLWLMNLFVSAGTDKLTPLVLVAIANGVLSPLMMHSVLHWLFSREPS